MIAIRQPINRGFHIHLEKDMPSVVAQIKSQDCEIYKIEDDRAEFLVKQSPDFIKSELDMMFQEGRYRTVREF